MIAKQIKNFNEVSLGFSKKTAIDEAKRCLGFLKTQDHEGCPLGIDIPEFIHLICEKNTTNALEKIREQNYFPGICGRVCPAPCEISRVNSPAQNENINQENNILQIRALERYAADFGKWITKKKIPTNKIKIAIVGSGPSGLTAAAALAHHGYQPTIFELMDRPGGVLRYGIPEFRLPKKVLDAEINAIKSLNVQIVTNCYIGKTMTFQDIDHDDFKAILIATGAGILKLLDTPNANAKGVYYGEEFLMRINSVKNKDASSIKNFNGPMGPKVIVIGSDNMAFDCARAAARLGTQVTLLSSQPTDDHPTLKHENEKAVGEGIDVKIPVKIVEIITHPNGLVSAVKCLRLDYADIKDKDKWELATVPHSEFSLETNTVILVAGHLPNTLIAKKILDGIKLKSDGTIWVNEKNGMTSLNGVFACGNVVTNANSVVTAMASGKKSAEHIMQYLQ